MRSQVKGFFAGVDEAAVVNFLLVFRMDRWTERISQGLLPVNFRKGVVSFATGVDRRRREENMCASKEEVLVGGKEGKGVVTVWDLWNETVVRESVDVQ